MASIEIKVPVLPESVADASIASWYKKPGDWVKRDEHLVDIETDKVVLEVLAPGDGRLAEVLKAVGDRVVAQEVIGHLTEEVAVEQAPAPIKSPETVSSDATNTTRNVTKAAAVSPSVRRLAESQSIDLTQIKGSGKSGRILKEDVLKASGQASAPSTPVSASTPSVSTVTEPTVTVQVDAEVNRVPMSRLRARIAARLVEAQQTAAILTTFNEVNMQPVMQLRQKYKDSFEKKHGVKLGFMSFFTVAVVEALKRFPIMNASVEGEEIVYHHAQHIGIAVSAPRGLVVPVLRQAQTLSMAEIERQIAAFGEKAKNNTLSLEDLSGGTFTISNGGVFGSLMSTPILNPPQSAILGMHKIEERPIVEAGQIQIRPMMYLALSYDHRIIDGADSVRFLVTIKEQLEDPARLLLGV